MNVLIDSGFWYAYYDGRDSYHQEAQKIMKLLEFHRILIPYPSLYETLDTRFCKRKEWVDHFRMLVGSSRCVLVQDDQYKDTTLELSFNSSLVKNRAISLVDMVIRQMIDDVNLKTDAVITFNRGDFDDICRKKNKQCISDFGMAQVLAG